MLEFGVEFEQFAPEYDESLVPLTLPRNYACAVVAEKAKQFFFKFENAKNVLFADSSVICEEQILGKAKDEEHAKAMLELQSGRVASVYTAMKFVGERYTLDMLSVASYRFFKFESADLASYLASGQWRGKAGAMCIEGFNKKYIADSRGNPYTAMGLDIINLKAYL